MTAAGWLQLALYVVVLLLLAKPLGATWRASTRAAPVRRSGSAGRSSG